MATGENERLAGRYRVIEQLGRGGMGVVWRAVDEVLGREVAVKELRTFNDSSAPELADLRVRMQREARAAARVRHPGVIAVHDVTDHDGRPVIVMELVDGPSLDDVLTERGVLDPREAASIGAEVLRALGAAHRVGVLHRDVKPGNILLDRSGRVVLTDFGIAAMDDPGDGSTTHLTRSGELVGSLDFLAPERAQGNDPGPASDVWALGATLYAAVEGISPFRRTSTWSTLTAIVADPLPEARRAGPLGPVLHLLMHKDPAQRPDADAAAGLLAAVAAGEDTAVTATLGGDVPGGIPGGAPAWDQQGAPGGPPQAAPRGVTERDVLPHRPEGFGPAVSPMPMPAQPLPAQPGPVQPGPGPGPAPGIVTTATPVPERRSGRGKVLMAVGVVAVLLAGGGVTYALTDHAETTSGGLAKGAGETESPGRSEQIPTGDKPSGAKPADPKPTGQGGEKPAKADTAKKQPDKGDGGKDKGEGGSGGSDGGAPGSTGGSGEGSTSGGSGGKTTGGSDGGASTSTTGGGGDPGTPDPAPVCDGVGGGKYNCNVWRSAKSYTAGGAEAGVLNAGINYFFCQQNLGRRETYGQWTNVWWAKTDDDSGNTGVFVSTVYLKGGDNDKPLPGLPVC